MGGSTALVAGALESRLRGVWVDSPACDPWEVLRLGSSNFMGGILSPVAAPLTDWTIAVGKNDWMDEATRVEWDANQPYLAVKKYTAEQSLAFVSSTGDLTVPARIVKKCVDAAKTSSKAASVDYWAVDDRKVFTPPRHELLSLKFYARY